ncbi:MAP3K14 [Mytilus edulis]|uniref:non-specific serine/threonine protein kinase n=1 Tax=Mytilus edulis TaxID=6550 RepID=A0A8S3VB49_MYTED|nr:MAP3K14 [Mytilus edulis]
MGLEEESLQSISSHISLNDERNKKLQKNGKNYSLSPIPDLDMTLQCERKADNWTNYWPKSRNSKNKQLRPPESKSLNNDTFKSKRKVEHEEKRKKNNKTNYSKASKDKLEIDKDQDMDFIKKYQEASFVDSNSHEETKEGLPKPQNPHSQTYSTHLGHSSETCRHRHRSETNLKQPCAQPSEHEEYTEKRDLSKDERQVPAKYRTKDLARIYRKLKNNRDNKNGTLDLILRLVRDGIFPIDQVQTNLETIIKTHQQLKCKLDQTNHHSKQSCQKESQKVLKVWCEEKEEDYEGEKMDPMKEEGVHTDLDPMKEEVVQFNVDQMTDSCVKDKIDKIVKLKTDDTKETLAVKEKCLVVECNGEVLKDEIESDKAEILLKLESCDSCKELEIQLTKSKKQKKKGKGKVTKRSIIRLNSFRNSEPGKINVTCQYTKKDTRKPRKSLTCKYETRYTRNQRPQYTGECKISCYQEKGRPHFTSEYTAFRRKQRPHGRQSTGGHFNATDGQMGKGDHPCNELTDSDSGRFTSRGSQKSDEEETEKEKHRRDDDEKDKDENEEPPVDSGNNGNNKDRISRNLDVITNFKYRRKHGCLSGGENNLSDILGLMLNETEELKVPPDIFDEINLCLMTSMQVKSAGETTTCYICTHLSALICHFGSCSMGYQDSCSICMTLFRLIQKHVSICGLSDSFTSEVTCPVIICVKLKRAEIADNTEKVWKKLKKNLARFANPDAVDDDPFSSIDSISSIKSLNMPRHQRLSTVSRPVLESIPELRMDMRMETRSQKPGSKKVSKSEPLMRKMSDGSTVMMTSNLPKRLQQQQEEPASLPYSQTTRHRSVTLDRPRDIFTDSTDYPLYPDTILYETADCIGTLRTPDSSLHLPPEAYQLPSDSSVHTSLPLVRDESLELASGGINQEYVSLPGRVYVEDRLISMPNVRPQEYRERYQSLVDRPTGTPGIQDVIYGDRSYLLGPARIWFDMKKQWKLGKKYDTREEGVILPQFQDRIKILKTRYSKNFQWVRLSHLGSGTSGKCHLAMDFNTDYKFCIKKIHISKYEFNELEIWSDLTHRNVVQLIGTLRRGEKIYILSEFIDGGCLTETINMQRSMSRRLSQITAINYFKQILEALVYLEKRYVIHEDLKADNILVRSGTKDVVITDFGVARKLTSSTDKRGATPSGSQIVFSPEKARGEGHGYKSDHGQLLIVVQHVTGYPPWVRKYPNIGALIYLLDAPTAAKGENVDIVKEIEEDLKSIHISNDCETPKKIEISEKKREPEENDSLENTGDLEKAGDRANSSIYNQVRRLAIDFGLSLPEHVTFQETEPPDNLFEEYMFDIGAITVNSLGLEECESTTEKRSSDSDVSQSDLEFEAQPHSDLPNFALLYPKALTEEEKVVKKEREAIVDEFADKILSHQLSRTESQNRSFDSYFSSQSEVSQEKIIDQMSKSSLDVPNLTVFYERNPVISKTQQERKDSESSTLTMTALNTLSPPSSVSSGSVEQRVEVLQRPTSTSPSIVSSMFSIAEEDDIDDENLFGSGEGVNLLQPNLSKSMETETRTRDISVKKTNHAKLYLDLSPATKRKQFAGGSRSDPNTASVSTDQTSPLPPTAPYFTPQVQRAAPFMPVRSIPKTTSGLGSSVGKSPPHTPHLSIENDTSGAFSSPQSQQEEIDKLIEEMSTSNTSDILMSQEIESLKFALEEDDDMEASMLYIQTQYCAQTPSNHNGSRLTVHYKPGETFTMELPGMVVKQQWKEIIEKECSDYIHDRMGVTKFVLLDDNEEFLDLQKSPSQGEIFVFVKDVEDTSTAPWYCEAGMIM